MSRRKNVAFSLVELLITLAMLGVITAMCVVPLFNIPGGRATTKYTAIARDTAFMLLTAYEKYRIANVSVSSSTTLGAITPYMNYVAVDTATTVDLNQTSTSVACSTLTCLKLHNGAMLFFGNTVSFGGTNSTNAISLLLDPDGVKTDNTTNGPGKSLLLYLQYDGSVHTRGNLPAPVTTSVTTFSADATQEPLWFQGF